MTAGTSLLKLWAEMPPHMLRDLRDENVQALAWAAELQHLVYATLQCPEKITDEELCVLPEVMAALGHHQNVRPDLVAPNIATQMIDNYYSMLSFNKDRVQEVSRTYKKQSPVDPWIYKMICCTMNWPEKPKAAMAWLAQNDFVWHVAEMTDNARKCLEMHYKHSGFQLSV